MKSSKKNPFKKQSAIDCAINVGIGGGANVAIDYAVDMLNDSMDAPIDDLYINIGKLAIGAVGSSMVSNKYLKSALDGIAVVGVSNLVKGLMDGSADSPGEKTPTSGVPFGTVGRIVRTPNLNYARQMGTKKNKRSVSGISDMIG